MVPASAKYPEVKLYRHISGEHCFFDFSQNLEMVNIISSLRTRARLTTVLHGGEFNLAD